MNLYTTLFLMAGLLLSCSTSSNNDQENNTDTADSLSITGEFHFFHGYPTFSSDSLVNVVIEIPAGTSAKWEVNKQTGKLEWPLRGGKPRTVDYLAYPANYGMIPQTLSPEISGGDGDPLDVFVLGPAIERGKVVQCKIIGVVKLLDDEERDDKFIAVTKGTPLENLNNLEDLNQQYPGGIAILQIWLSNYKAPGELQIESIESALAARKVLFDAMEDYQKDISQ